MKKTGASNQRIKYLEELYALQHFTGPPPQFWALYLKLILSVSEAHGGVIAARLSENDSALSVISASGAVSLLSPDRKALVSDIEKRVLDCISRDTLWIDNDEERILSMRLDTGTQDELCIACLLFKPNGEQTEEPVHRVKLISDMPALYQGRRVAIEAKNRVEQLSSVLDLMACLNEKKRFLPAAMTFCNEIASRLKCERVSIGWLERGYVRIKAISHVDRFDKKTETVKKLEEAQEEALDQDTEVIFPARGSGGTVNRNHMAFARANDVSQICSMPFRHDGEPVSVCTCERNSAPFSEVELRLLRMSCDQAVTHLASLKRSDRWFGARIASGLREKLGSVIGFKHTWLKVLAIVTAIALGILLFGQIDYRISAPAILRTENVAFLTSPFDGHIDRVMVRVGDAVKAGDTLLSLDQSDLRLQESATIAERNRYRREVEKARASGSLADMQISQALLDQSIAKLELTQYQIGKASIRAPFEGIIVEGNQIERIGAPTRQGETLFKLARIDELFSELKVSESDIHELKESQSGEIILTSRPRDVFTVKVTRIEPVAVTEQTGNVFMVRCDFQDEPKSWWRPGMTGIAKMSAGNRNILWIISHRTMDFIRLHLWL
jgi:RND family efflux transporter MFP subunit